MELFGQTIVFLLGLVLALVSANDIWNRFSWGQISTKDPLIILIPAFIGGCYLIYLVFN